MVTYNLRNSLGDLRNEPRIFKFSDWRVELRSDFFKLVMSIELNNPTEALELIHKTCVDEMYWAFIDTNSVLWIALNF